MDEQITELIGEYRSGRMERAEFLKWAAVLGLGGLVLGETLARPATLRAATRRAPVRGGSVKVGGGTPVAIDPPLLIDGLGIALAQQVGEWLVNVGPDLVPRPALATSWKPSQNGQVWTITLRRGVTFHSGKALTADDVVATFKRLVDPKQASTAQSSLSFLTPEGITRIDDHTVQFNLERPVVDFPYYLNTYQALILPTTYDGHFAKQPDGTGPFKLVEYVPGQRARYVRNPTYWNKPLPYVDSVEFILGYSTDGLLTALLGGSIDTWVVTNYTQLPIIRANSALKIATTNSSGHNGIFMRTDRTPFSDVRVRQAFALAIDRSVIVNNVNQKLAVPGNDNSIAPVFPVHTPIPQRAKDLARARALLTAAGYAKGLSVTVTTAADSGTLVALAVAAQQMLAPLGVTVELQGLPSSLYYNNPWLQAPLTVTDWAHRPTPSQFLNVAYRSGAPWNASHWSNPRFDSLVKSLDATIDLATRKSIAHQIELLQTDQTPALLTFFSQIARPMKVGLQGVVADPASRLDLSTASWAR